VNHLRHALKQNLADKRVGILGMAFKADSDDIRDSLSYKLVKVLKFYGACVVCSDEYVKDANFVTKEQLIETCPIIMIGVPHSAYRGLVFPAETLVVDLWGVVS
jgi:UDP-N-acetyl-D-mannosaminuronic acid dehydrogenase